MDGETEQLTYMPALRVEQRVAGGDTSDEALLTIAKSMALDPSVFEEAPPRFFQGIISTNANDAYDTSMRPSMLKAFAEDASRGVAYLTGHNNRVDPTGHSVLGRFTPGNGDGKARTTSWWYILQDASTQPHVTKLRGGVVKDLSVGFSGGFWECSICGRDMSRGWWREDGCKHMLGVSYVPTDGTGKKTGPAQVARAGIESTPEQPGHLHEYSGVYDGATPGSMTVKAMELAGENYFTELERGIITARYRIALPERRIVSSGVTISRAVKTAEGGREMPDENETQGTTPTPAPAERVDLLVGVRHLLKNAGVDENLEPVEAVRALAEQVLRLMPQAEDGRQYRSDLMDEAKKQCVRAGLDAQAYEPALVNAPIALIRRFRDDWEKAGNDIFKAGRQTASEEEKPAPVTLTTGKRDLDVPDTAYRVR